MNKSLKSIENNEATIKDSKQRPKQVTLFDMKSKGKFSINSDSEFSPKLGPKNETQKISKNDEDDVVILDENEENFQKKSPTKKIKKKKDDLNNSKINKFFKQTSEEEVQIEDDSNRTQFNDSLENSKLDASSLINEKKRNSFKSIVEKNGTLALKENNGSSLENRMFGEVATVIELYNLLTNIFIKNSKNHKKSKKKDLEFMKIDLNQFVSVFDCNSADGKSYFIKIVQNILKLYIFYEKLFGYRFPFNHFFNDLSLEPCFLQELVRYVLNIVSPQIDYRETNSELDLLYTQDKLLKCFPLFQKLATNYSEEPFGDFSLNSKLDLLRFLCENLLLTKSFENFKNYLEEEIEKNKIRLKQYKKEINDLFVKKNGDSIQKMSDPIGMARRIQLRPGVKGKLSKYDRLNTRIKNQIELNEKMYRLKPVGTVFNDAYIWNFSFVNGLVVEFRNDDKSEWFILDTVKAIQAVIVFLKNNPKLCSELKKIRDNLKKKNKSDDEDEKSEESEADEEKEEKKYSLRNADSSSLAAKAELSEAEDSEDEELDFYLKTLDPKIRISFLKKLASVSSKFEWIQFDGISYSIDMLWKYLMKQIGKAHYYGITNGVVYDQIISLLRSYSIESDFEEKFNIIKKVLIEFGEVIGYYHLKYLLLKSGKMLPNGKRIYEELKDFICGCQSLSALYLMTYFFMSSVKWTNFRPMKPCSICKENYDENDYREFVDEKIFSQVDCFNIGFYTCMKCHMPTHKKCDSMRDANQNFVCKDCLEKAKVFDYLGNEEHEHEHENESSNFEKIVKGGKILRNKKKVNYNPDAKISHDNESRDCADLSSNSNSSLFEKYSRKVINSVPQRSSSRLKNSNPINYSDY